jgi:hypothetical protein
VVVEVAVRLKLFLLCGWTLGALRWFQQHLKIRALVPSLADGFLQRCHPDRHNQLLRRRVTFLGLSQQILDEEVHGLPANRRLRLRGNFLLHQVDVFLRALLHEVTRRRDRRTAFESVLVIAFGADTFRIGIWRVGLGLLVGLVGRDLVLPSIRHGYICLAHHRVHKLIEQLLGFGSCSGFRIGLANHAILTLWINYQILCNRVCSRSSSCSCLSGSTVE